MIVRFDAHSLLYHPRERDRFWDNISVSRADLDSLESCRQKTREAIRRAFSQVREASANGYPNRFLDKAFPSERVLLGKVLPRFRPQGSSVYKTLNLPAHVPPQQTDFDDGVYLPMAVIEKNPVINKNIFFEIVDSSLEELVRQEGWLALQQKNTCARVAINRVMHIDVPLYAIPDENFQTLSARLRKRDDQFDDVLLAFSEDLELDEDEIYLAVRNQKHWKRSDPSKIEKWFVREVNRYGERLRRVCRYLKAWRDYTWESGGPSSITLMICTWRTFGSSRTFASDSDALLAVAEDLAEQLSNVISNPGDDSDQPEEIYPRSTSYEERQNHIGCARVLAQTLRAALTQSTTSEEVVGGFVNQFGPRVPNMPEVIVAADIGRQIASQRRVKQERPRVPRNLRSG